MRGTYIYGAARADSVLAALAAMSDVDQDLELLGVEWLQTFDELRPSAARTARPSRPCSPTLGDAQRRVRHGPTDAEDAGPTSRTS